jgi:hypothetical protein
VPVLLCTLGSTNSASFQTRSSHPNASNPQQVLAWEQHAQFTILNAQQRRTFLNDIFLSAERKKKEKKKEK